MATAFSTYGQVSPSLSKKAAISTWKVMFMIYEKKRNNKKSWQKSSKWDSTCFYKFETFLKNLKTSGISQDLANQWWCCEAFLGQHPVPQGKLTMWKIMEHQPFVDDLPREIMGFRGFSTSFSMCYPRVISNPQPATRSRSRPRVHHHSWDDSPGGRCHPVSCINVRPPPGSTMLHGSQCIRKKKKNDLYWTWTTRHT